VSGPLAVSLDVSAVPAQPAGAGRYTLDLADALARRHGVTLTLVARHGDSGRWRRLLAGAGAAGRVVPRAPESRPLRLAWEQARLPGLLGQLDLDVHHGPHYTMPERARLPVVVTVHDVTFFDHPEWHERSKVLLFRRAIAVAARRASVVVCVSQTTADALARVVPVSVPVRVATHGVDLGRFSPEEPSPGADRMELGALGLDPDRPFVLAVGTLEPRKGLVGLVRAFDRIAGAHRDLVLVLAGQPGWGPDLLGPAVAAADHGDRVVRTGYVPDRAVPALLRQAAAVAYPSLEEGYGLPALEALACGAPLVTTSGTAMEELAGPAALLVPPGDEAALAAALEQLVGGPDPGRAERRDLGLARAAQRTWAASAAQHEAAYAAAVGQGVR